MSPARIAFAVVLLWSAFCLALAAVVKGQLLVCYIYMLRHCDRLATESRR